MPKARKAIFKLLFHYNFVLEKATTKTKILPKAGKINFQLLCNHNFELEKATTETKILPKTIENQFFNYFLIEILIGKSNHQNQNIAKSWKNQFNYFWISILQEKNNHQNQDIAKSWKFSCFNYFLNKNFNLKKQPPKPKARKNYFSITFELKLLLEKATTKTKILPTAGKAWDPKKTKTLIEKTIRVLKNFQIQMKKVHSTVFHNAWDQKGKHSH